MIPTKVEKLISVILDLMEDSDDGIWMTDNEEINCDNIIIDKTHNALNIFYNNDVLNIKFDDIVGICFDLVQTMVVAIIKIKNKEDLLIHIL